MGGGAYDIYRLSCEFAQIDLGLATSMLAVGARHRPDPRRLHRGAAAALAAEDRRRGADRGLRVTEPEAGSNVQNVQTVARPIAGTDGTVTHYALTASSSSSPTVRSPTSTPCWRRPRRPVVLRRRARHARPHARQARGQARHPALRHRAGDPRGGRRPGRPADRPEGRRGAEAGQRGLRLHAPDGRRVRPRRGDRGARQGGALLEAAPPDGRPLSEKQGYTHKLLVPNSVRLAAAKASSST